MAEAMQWPVAGLERALESWAYLIVAWVNANGGEALYEHCTKPGHEDLHNPNPRIIVRTANGWADTAPGQWVVMGEWLCEHDTTDRRAWSCRRDFYRSDTPPAAASCGSPDTKEER